MNRKPPYNVKKKRKAKQLLLRNFPRGWCQYHLHENPADSASADYHFY